MKIAFISPKVNFTTNIAKLQELWDASPQFEPYRKLWSHISPGSGLLTLAALTPSSYEIDFIDENIDEIDFSKHYDLVGITAMTQQAVRAYSIGDRFREKESKVVIGGIHASILPQEAKKHADSVVIGEAEYLWSDILHDVINKTMKPFYKAERPVDLKDSPTPRFDLLKPNTYSAISIQTSRGCPHDCEYCAASKIFGSAHRRKTLEQVVDEVTFVKNHFDNIKISFSDDNFFVKRTFSKTLLKQLIPFNIRWYTQSDISIGADPELLELMKKSGCMSVFIGLESLSPDGLKTLDKHGWKFRQLKNYSQYIHQIQHHGIEVIGAFMVGLDGDDIRVFEKIINFVTENNIFIATITIQTPLPGTRLRKRWEAEARVLPTSWDNYTGYNVNHIPKKMTREDLEAGLVTLYKKIYREDVYLRKMKYFTEIEIARRKKRKKEQGIDKHFKTAVTNLNSFLKKTQRRLDAPEYRIDNHKALGVLQELFPSFSLTLDKKLTQIEDIIESLTVSHREIPHHKQYYQTHLHPFLLTSPLNHRAYVKPLGYAGDYEMIRMVHEDAFNGSTLFSRLVNHYSISLPIAKAARKRTEYLCEKIYEVVTQHHKSPVEILSVGSGPALEFKMLFEKHPEITHHISLTLLDQEIQALQFSQAHLHENQMTYNSKINMNSIHQKIEDYFGQYEKQNRRKTYDFIYSFGLFDYFDYKVSRLMIKCLLHLIHPGGRLLIANCSLDGHHHRYFMEYGLEWYLIYRDRDELIKLTEGISKAKDVEIDEIEHGMIKFLEITC